MDVDKTRPVDFVSGELESIVRLDSHTSEKVGNIITAFVAARADFKPILKDKINPHYKSKYATLDSILSSTVPALTKHGLCIVQVTEGDLESPRLITRLYHTSGEYLESRLTVQKSLDMQKLGSALTYGRRYAIAAILNISADEDDDGNATLEAKTSSYISDAQAKRLLAISSKQGWTVTQVKDYLSSKKIQNSSKIKKSDYESICADMEKETVKKKYIK